MSFLGCHAVTDCREGRHSQHRPARDPSPDVAEVELALLLAAYSGSKQLQCRLLEWVSFGTIEYFGGDR